jgi:hypothetical protein
MRIGHKTIFQWLLGASLLICASVACGCGSGPAQDASRPDFPVPETRSKSNGDFPSAPVHYDLGRDEDRGGHTLKKHVARTDEQLRERLQQEHNISAASTWTDRATAETVVAEALAAQRNHVGNWMHRGYPRPNVALHYDSGRVIGRSLRRGGSAVVDCTQAVVVLRADGPDGFYVLTTYPEARE